MKPLISCTNVCKRIRQFYLDGIEFSLEPGYILGVIGRNGAGKSTLMQLILGGYFMDAVRSRQLIDEDMRGSYKQGRLELRSPLSDKRITPVEGDIVIDGFSMRYHPSEAKQRMAYVLSDCPFSMVMSGLDNARLYGTCYDRWQQEQFLNKCGEFGLDVNLPLKKYNKGQRILYQLAFAIACNAKLYIMDEPVSNLDVSYRQLILDTMQELVEGGDKSVIYVTHLLEDLEQVGDYILWLEEGQQVLFGEKEELLNSYRILTGTSKQFRYVEQAKPDAFLSVEYQPHASQGLVKGTGEDLPLILDSRRPTLEELLVFYHAYYKNQKAKLVWEEENEKPHKTGKHCQLDGNEKDKGSYQEKRVHFESPFD